MTDFRSQFQAFEEFLKTATSGIRQKFDRATYRMLVDCLKSEDPEAVRVAIEQLVKEKNPMGVPPLYVVAKAHPSTFIREKAGHALKELDPQGQALKIADGREYKEAVVALVKHFGNYKA